MRLRYVLLALLVVVALLASTAAASPRPVQVCQPCGEGFARAVDGSERVPDDIAGDEVTVTNSTATVRVYDNGTAVWTVRNRLANRDLVDYFRDNRDALRAVAADAWRFGDAELVSAAALGDGAVRLQYRVEGFATRTNGVLRVDYFREDPGRYVFYDLGADRLTLVGPEDTRVTSGMPGATVDGNRLTTTEYRGRGDGPFVVFASKDDPMAGVSTHAAIAAATGGLVVRNLLLLVALPAAALALCTWTAGSLAARELVAVGRERARRIGGVVAAAGLVLALYGALPGYQELVGGYAPWAVAAGVAGAVIGGGVAARPDGWTLRRLVVLVAGGTLAGTVAAAGGAMLLGADLDDRLMRAVLPVAVPLWMAVVGAARETEGRVRRTVLALPAVGFAAAMVATTQLTAEGGTLFIIVPVLYVGYAVAATLAGVPLLALGAAVPLADREGGGPRQPRHGDHAAE